MLNVIVIGYYDRGNLGDDMFNYALQKYVLRGLTFGEEIVNTRFVNIDEATSSDIKSASVIFFGPGDVFNEYFLRKLDDLKIPETTPLYALGIGFPYPTLITRFNLRRFDYIMYRNVVDHDSLIEMVDEKRIQYTPDPTWFIMNDVVTCSDPYRSFIKNSTKIGICLTRTMFDPLNPLRYGSIIDTLAKVLTQLIKGSYTSRKCFTSYRKNDYELYLIPFYCDPRGINMKPLQDDRIINKDLYKSIQLNLNDDKLLKKHVHLIANQPEYSRVKDIFGFFNIVVANRFHSHVFSAIATTPFVSIYTTRKVELLIKELGLEDMGISCKLDTDPVTDFPLGINGDNIKKCFENVIVNYATIKTQLLKVKLTKAQELYKLKRTIQNLIYYRPRYCWSEAEIREKAIRCAQQIKTLDFDIENSVEDIMHVNGLIGYLFGTLVNSEIINTLITQLIMYTLFGERVMDYNYGLSQQLFTQDYNLYESIKWILIHHRESHHPIFDKIDNESLLDNNIAFRNRRFNIVSKNNLTSYHRSGWGYVTKHLNKLVSSKLIPSVFDPYLDKTFGWDAEFLTTIGVLPLTTEWSGIFHHTPTPNYALYTLDKMFKEEVFIKSLKHLKHIFVFSTRLKEWMDKQLLLLNEQHQVQVVNGGCVQVIKHPTEFVNVCSQFNPYKLFANPSRKLVQIGAWLRNTYAIYDVRVPDKYCKTALKGNGMEHYYIDDARFCEIEKALIAIGNDEDHNCQPQMTGGQMTSGCPPTCPSGCPHPSGCPCHDSECDSESDECSSDSRSLECVNEEWKTNKYVKGLIDSIKTAYNSVKIINRIENDEYDKLLSENIVFINLVDASAVNTLIECIVRNTPILVNRIPAVVEYIGNDYPFLYDSIDEVYSLLENDKNVVCAYNYLKRLDKSELNIETFLISLLTYL